jgi:hypothetical protein
MMSAPTGSGTAEARNGDRRMSLGKYVKRMSSVFKREKSSKTSDLAAPVAPSVVASHQQEPAKEEAIDEAVA